MYCGFYNYYIQYTNKNGIFMFDFTGAVSEVKNQVSSDIIWDNIVIYLN